MKKTILATVLVLATTVASAQVTVSGKIGQYIDSTKTGVTTVNSMASEPTSNITFRSSETLGNDLTASVVIDTKLFANDPKSVDTQLGDRQSTVGLSSKLGSVNLGRNVHSEFLALAKNDVFGAMYGSIAGDVHNLRGLRMSNGTFVSITPMNGVTLTADNAHNAAGADASSYSLSAGAYGVNGTVATYTAGSEKSTVVGLSTKVGKTTVVYTYSDNEGAVNSTGNLIGVSQSFGAVTAKASYGTTSTDVKAYAVGVEYAFSKRTDVGVVYRNVDAVGTSRDVAQIGVGLTHRF
jgi:predicted porin